MSIAQLRADGVPEQLIEAHPENPRLIRAAWEKQQADEQQDPRVRKQAKRDRESRGGSGGAAC